ncbi:transcriptional regulator [Clostridioides difficile]
MFKRLSQAEFQVMKFIWNEKDIVASKQIIEVMEQKHNWKMTTTLTVLSRIVNKRFLGTERIKRITHYTILITRKEYIQYETRRFLNDIHSNSLESLFSSLENCNIKHKK